jgi:hypothetical protein
MQRDRLPYLLIPLAACIAILPLILNGCSCGHDFDFHLLNWMEAARQFTHANLHPHWAYTAAYNAGEPRFVFYPPLSWTLGAVLTLLFPITAPPILYTWLALTASGLALHFLAREFTPPTPALLAAILYTVNPYMLFTAYERTAYAELLAAAFIPLLLHAILRNEVTIPRIAIPVALLWLTNAPAAVMSCYALALLAIIRVATNSVVQSRALVDTSCTTNDTATQTSLSLVINTTSGTLLGLALAAFYILPAAYERRYVQIAMAIIPNMRVQDNFLFHHTGDAPHDQVLHTASILAVLLIIATIIAIVVSVVQLRLHRKPASARPADYQNQSSSRPERREAGRSPYLIRVRTTYNIVSLIPSLAILTIAITLLLTPLTTIIWNHAPELAFLQFPWRFLAILAAIMSLAFALAIASLNLKPSVNAAITVALAAAFSYPAYSFFHQACDEEDTPTARAAIFYSNQGTDSTDEYTPTTADNDSLAHNDPAFWLSPNPNEKDPNAKYPNTQTSANNPPAPAHLAINAPVAEDLIINLRNYPSWHITRNGSPITQRDQRDDGLIAFPIPAGPSLIAITYGQTLDQTIGDAISLLALVGLPITLRLKPSRASS